MATQCQIEKIASCQQRTRADFRSRVATGSAFNFGKFVVTYCFKYTLMNP
ncbi:hypothetical protein EG68_07165, partial [Paragonimus skrjabini miyazakii]